MRAGSAWRGGEKRLTDLRVSGQGGAVGWVWYEIGRSRFMSGIACISQPGLVSGVVCAKGGNCLERVYS